MVLEKKQIVHGLRLNYNGPFSIEEFYAEVEDWIKQHGMHKDLKRKSEMLHKNKKTVEWMIEAWKSFDKDSKEVVHLHVMFNDFKERKVIRSGRTIRFHHADIYMEFNSWLEENTWERWTQAPLYTFFRALYDKYIWPILDAHDGYIHSDTYDLHKRLKTFFDLYRMRIGD